jgi:cytochrome c biogenesis protein
VAAKPASIALRISRALTSIQTGIILLILVVIASVAGTLILQRPITEPAELARAYRPETLQWLDRLGLTDVFHSWWFLTLMTLLALNIVLASLDRWPEVWRYFARPYRKPERHFMAALPLQEEIVIPDTVTGMRAAQIAFKRVGLRPKKIGQDSDLSLYAERYRFARLAAYVVHASLLLILAGGIVDGLWGYRGFVVLTMNGSVNEIEMRDGGKKALPFTLRCDGAGQENYPDGSPRRWWSKLAVVENGAEVKRKEIEVNEPLVHRGLRFYQSSYGQSGEVGSIQVRVSKKDNAGAPQDLTLGLGETRPLDASSAVTFARFLPDFVVRGREVESRSNELNNPAILLLVKSGSAEPAKVWLFPRFPDFSHPTAAAYSFEFRDMQMGYYTGLQVSYEPGQWAVWGGCLLMALGLAMAFYFVHLRAWAVPVSDGRGRLVLWVGASASKNRDELEERFRRLVSEIRRALESEPVEQRSVTLAHA